MRRPNFAKVFREKSVEAVKKSRLQVKGFRSSCKICEKVFLLYTLSKKEALCPPLSDRQCKSGGGVPFIPTSLMDIKFNQQINKTLYAL